MKVGQTVKWIPTPCVMPLDVFTQVCPGHHTSRHSASEHDGRQAGEVLGSGGWPANETSGKELKPSIKIKQEVLRSNFIKLPENKTGAKSS